MIATDLTRMLNIRYPILQAGMAGGPTTPALVAAVSNAGGLGHLGAAYLTPEQLRGVIREIKQLTDHPFGVNLFVPAQPQVSETSMKHMTEQLNRHRAALGIEQNPTLGKVSESFEEQFQVLLEEKVPVFSFTFGIPPEDMIQSIKKQGTVVIGTATTVEEAIQLEKAGADAVVAQGSEAGGHRGTFLKDPFQSLIGTMALVPQVVDHVSIPVIASGGIMDGRGLVASLALGACAVQMGTAFLAAPESGAHAAYKDRILRGTEDSTAITTVYSGKPARGIRTEFMQEMNEYTGTIPEFPIQNAMTQDIRRAAAKANNTEYMSLWAGQGLRLATGKTAAEIIAQTIDDAETILKQISRL